jgi:hypothetical protein
MQDKLLRKFEGLEFLAIMDQLVKMINQMKKYNVANTAFLTFTPNISFDKVLPVLMYEYNSIEMMERLLKPRDFTFEDDNRFDMITVSPPLIIHPLDPIARECTASSGPLSYRLGNAICISLDEFKKSYEANGITSLDLTGREIRFKNHMNNDVQEPICYFKNIPNAVSLHILALLGSWTPLGFNLLSKVSTQRFDRILGADESKTLFEALKDSVNKIRLGDLDFYRDFVKIKPSHIKVFSETDGDYQSICLEQTCSGYTNYVFYKYIIT